MCRRAAGYVEEILKGADPGELPVRQATKFDLVLNLRTARAIGLTIPPPIVLRAAQVIEERAGRTAPRSTGPVGARLDRREFDAVRQHLRLERENMGRILEAQRANS